MTWSLARPAVHRADTIAMAWALDDLGADFGAVVRTTAASTRQAAAELALVEPTAAERHALELAQLRAAMAAERDALVQQAYAQGYEEGRVEGELAEGARLRNAVASAERALEEIRESESRWAGTIEENVCALSTAVARQIVGRELQGDPATFAALVRRALAEFPIDQALVIRVCPSDLATLESASEEGVPDVSMDMDEGRAAKARWVADARVAPGGCLVEGRDRIVDGRVDTALERVYRRLTYTNA